MFLQNNNRHGPKRVRNALFVCIILGIVVAALNLLMPHILPALFSSVAKPYWRTKFSIESGSLMPPDALIAENESLKRQIETYKADALSVQALSDENAEIKSLLGRDVGSSTSPEGRLLSAVLSRPPFAPYDELIIDVGADDGIIVGDRVYAAENSLIGRVEDVLPQTSKVVLYTSPGQHIEVMIGPSHAPAQALGRGGGQYSAELPSIVRVAKGDTVMASSLGDKPIAVVQGITSDPASAFETVLFAPLVNIYELRWVTVQKTKR